MTKLSNLDNSDNRDKELDALFANIPLETPTLADLPSKGRFYTGFKGVQVSPLLFEDEQRILLSKNKNINPVNEIISKCITGINLNDLLIMDKLYLLLKIKEISYGPEYKFETTCPKCGFRAETSLDVSKNLPITYVSDEISDPREITLPVLKAKVGVRFPRVVDEQYLSDIDIALNNLYRFVVSINDNKDPVFIAKALKKMNIRDLKTISMSIHRNDLGVDARFIFECPECKYNAPLGVPFDANFFSVS